MATTISIDGANGETLARSSGIRLVQDDTQALVPHIQQHATRHGQPGRNAPQAIPGGPAGSLAIQLSESQISQGAIHVRVVNASQAHRLPPHTEVAIGRELALTAIGGIGECGHDGGHGQSGLNGVDGTSASKGTDATNGTDGGNGGDAGRGTSGANGGSGGDVHIIMDQNSTHLIIAVSWDLSGGKGGRAGNHGNHGSGGMRGTGGQGWRWEEIVGYKYFCTSSCIKRDDAASTSSSTTTAMIRMGSKVQANSSALTAPIGAMLVSGNLQRAILQARLAYKAVERPRADTGACKCGGGSGTCTGCDMKPIYKTFKRAPGLDGRDGEAGASVTEPLLDGREGEKGTVTIAVQHLDGSTQRYTSPWSLELVDFEVEDDNADGIFEPGEFLHIRRVRVRNIGGMPSPTCRIAVTLADHSHNLEEVEPSHGGAAFLPSSIPAAGEASMEGSIKVRIKPNNILPTAGTRFRDKAWLQIRADMPWLERRMPSFELRKEIEIAYPCGFGDFEHLSTIAQGATSEIRYEINNFGNKSLGESGELAGPRRRIVEVSMTIPDRYGRLLSSPTDDGISADQSVSLARPRDKVSMHQRLRVLATAKNHGQFPVTFDLYLESPDYDQGTDLVFVERRIVNLQVSSMYSRNPNAQFLLVTNPHTTEPQSRAIQDFIRNSLLMEVDLCNIHQNGGLLRPQDSDIDKPLPLLADYHHKTVIFLNDKFDFFDAGERDSIQLCDPTWLHTLAKNHSTALFLGTTNKKAFHDGVRYSVLPISHKITDSVTLVKAAHSFNSPEELATSIIQERKLKALNMTLSMVATKAKWYHSKSSRDEKAAIDLVSFLRDRLPNERFAVSHDNAGHVIVYTGLSRHHHICSTESEISLCLANDSDPTPRRLDRFSKYLIISAISFRQRIDMIWRGTEISQGVEEAVKLSIVEDLIREMSGLQISRYKGLLRTDKGDTDATDIIVKTHLPFLGLLFDHPRANYANSPPQQIISVLAWAYACSSAIKRHRSLREIIISLLRNHTSTAHVLDSSDFNSAVAVCDPEHFVDAISAHTQTARYILEKGQISTSDVVPKTEYWPPGKWNAVVTEIEQESKRVQDDMAAAKKELGRMLMEPLASRGEDAAELSGELIEADTV